MVTASHLPVNRNGAKFCTVAGGLEKADIAALLQRAAELACAAGVSPLDPFVGTAFVLSSALQTSEQLSTHVDFLPVSGGVGDALKVCRLATRMRRTQVYSAYLRDLIKRSINHPTRYDMPLDGLKIVVDAGNGSGGFMATQVLQLDAAGCVPCAPCPPAVSLLLRRCSARWVLMYQEASTLSQTATFQTTCPTQKTRAQSRPRGVLC